MTMVCCHDSGVFLAGCDCSLDGPAQCRGLDPTGADSRGGSSQQSSQGMQDVCIVTVTLQTSRRS